MPNTVMNYLGTFQNGLECLWKVRPLRKHQSSIAKFRNHLHYNLHVKQRGLTTTIFNQSSAIHSRKEVNVLGRALLGVRITQAANDLENKQHELANSVANVSMETTVKRYKSENTSRQSEKKMGRLTGITSKREKDQQLTGIEWRRNAYACR